MGEGSLFSFTVTLQPAQNAISTAPEDSIWTRVTHLAQAHTVRALIADDIFENRDVLSTILKDVGVQTTLVENGQQAVEATQQNAFDIIFLDIRMPVLSGPDAAQQIWTELGDQAPHIVAVSASALEHEQQQYLAFGFERFIGKPFRTELIYQCLHDLLNVEFEYADIVASEATELDLSTITLSDNTIAQLTEAAELANVTELERILNDLKTQNPEVGKFADHLRGLSQDFKMDEVLQILGDLRRQTS